MGTILFVDDDDKTRVLISHLLERSGHEVVLASSAEEALAVLAQPPRPDLVLADLAMPDRDGLDLLREVRAKPWGRDLPFVFLTARASAENFRLAQQARADGFLAKPISSKSLQKAVSEFLD